MAPAQRRLTLLTAGTPLKVISSKMLQSLQFHLLPVSQQLSLDV